MKKLFTFAVVVAACAMVAQAQMVLYDDFESYPVDETIHGKGLDTTAIWGEIPRWYVNGNTSALADPGFAKVRSFGGNQVLEGECNVPPGDPNTDLVYPVAMSMESVQIDDYGVIYLRYAVDGTQSSLVMTNDLQPGWDYDSLALVDPGTMGADGWQEGCDGSGYTKNGAIVGMYTDNGFYARDGGVYYTDLAQNLPNQEWIELWILVDHPNDRTQYYRCVQGGTPVQMLDAGGDVWWTMRNQDWENNSVRNLKFMVSGWGFDLVEHYVYVDTIGIEQFDTLAELEAAPLNMVGPELLPAVFGPTLQADFDDDGDVDLDDFVILKSNFGTGTTHAQGDADLDGNVDLDDFVILKNEFGS